MHGALKTFAGIFGTIMIVIAGLSYLWFAIGLYYLYAEPENIDLIKSMIQIQDAGSNTLFTITTDSTFHKLRVDQSVIYFIYFLAAAILLAAIAAVFNTLIKGGIQLVAFSMSDETRTTKNPKIKS